MQYVKPVLTFTFKLVVQLLSLLAHVFVLFATAFVESMFTDDESVEKRETDYDRHRRVTNEIAKNHSDFSHNYEYRWHED